MRRRGGLDSRLLIAVLAVVGLMAAYGALQIVFDLPGFTAPGPKWARWALAALCVGIAGFFGEGGIAFGVDAIRHDLGPDRALREQIRYRLGQAALTVCSLGIAIAALASAEWLLH